MAKRPRPYFNQYRYMRSVMNNRHMSQNKLLTEIEIEWKTYIDFEDYVDKHLGPRPSLSHVMTRKDLTKGWFTGNIEWAEPVVKANRYRAQTMNTGLTYRGRPVSIKQYCQLRSLNYDQFIHSRCMGLTLKECERRSRAR